MKRNTDGLLLTCSYLRKEGKDHEIKEIEREVAGTVRGQISKCVNSKHPTHLSPFVLLIFKNPSSCHNNWYIQ